MAVALYARVSTVRQAEADLSIPDQLNQMRGWCRANGFTIAQEYVEPGATATDERRPMFQRMMDDATAKPSPFEAVIVHSRSRFFRDMYGCLHHERLLRQAGVKIISITQPTTDDATGELLKNVISMMDAYSSQENAKHTSRAMKENARRGFFNGSRAPFGYKVVDTDVPGHKGKVRKRLEVDELEARVVRRIFELYTKGHEGHAMGVKLIAKHLNDLGTLMRGRPWRIQKVSDVLSDVTYRGEYCYNMRDSRNGVMRPESDWVRCAVEPIVDAETFDAARRLREQRDPKAVTPATVKRVAIPTLLTGIIHCEHCGAAMTLATGKSGRYKYYKCCRKMSIGPDVCNTPNVAMERMDRLVLERLVERVLAPERVTGVLREWLTEQAKRDTHSELEMERLTRALRAADERLNNLYQAIETGVVSLDASLKARVDQLRDEREKVLSEIGLVKRERPSPRKVSPKLVAYACKRMREMLLDTERGYGKQLLTLLVSDIRVGNTGVTMTGSKAALANAVSETKLGTSVEVPSVVQNWRARQDSNPRPPGS